jgi:hypothetical protein
MRTSSRVIVETLLRHDLPLLSITMPKLAGSVLFLMSKVSHLKLHKFAALTTMIPQVMESHNRFRSIYIDLAFLLLEIKPSKLKERQYKIKSHHHEGLPTLKIGAR